MGAYYINVEPQQRLVEAIIKSRDGVQRKRTIEHSILHCYVSTCVLGFSSPRLLL